MAQALNRPQGKDYNPVYLNGDKREWPLEAPVGLRRVIGALGSFFSGGRGSQGPRAYRIYFHKEMGDHGAVAHVLTYGTGSWNIAPGDFAALIDAGLVQIRSSDPGEVSFYFVMPEKTGAMKAELERQGY